MRTQNLTLASLFFAAACAANAQKPVHDPTQRYGFPTASMNHDASIAGATGPSVATPNSTGGSPEPSRRAEVWAEPRTGGSLAPTNPAVPPTPAKNVDNTKVNERDRPGNTLTPMDQGNSDYETKISGEIRRAIMNDNTLSFTSKNVKIITTGTKVTLRGPVNTAYEKAIIESIAKRTSGVTLVDNQLEVKQ